MIVGDNTTHERLVVVHFNEALLRKLVLDYSVTASVFPISDPGVTVEIIFSESNADSSNRKERHAVVKLRQNLLTREPAF